MRLEREREAQIVGALDERLEVDALRAPREHRRAALAPQPAAAPPRSDSPSNADARIARLLKLVTILLVALVLVLAAFVVVLVVVLERG